GGAAVRLAGKRRVVVVPTEGRGGGGDGATGRPVRRLQDLARPGLRLVITAAQVPIGRYTRQALAKLSGPGGLGVDFQRKVMANVVSQEANVRSLLAKVELGEADAAIVYASDAVAAGPHVKTIAIPDRYNVIARYPVGIVVGSPHAGHAAAFLQFLQ